MSVPTAECNQAIMQKETSGKKSYDALKQNMCLVLNHYSLTEMLKSNQIQGICKCHIFFSQWQICEVLQEGKKVLIMGPLRSITLGDYFKLQSMGLRFMREVLFHGKVTSRKNIIPFIFHIIFHNFRQRIICIMYLLLSPLRPLRDV